MPTTTQWLGLGHDSLAGGSSTISEEKKLIREGMLRLLMLKPGEFRANPTRGNQAFAYLHLPITAGVAAVIAYSCAETLKTFEDRVLIDLELYPPIWSLNETEGGLDVQIPYQWPNSLLAEILPFRVPITKT
jgi:phage baseplate assembly protein W